MIYSSNSSEMLCLRRFPICIILVVFAPTDLFSGIFAVINDGPTKHCCQSNHDFCGWRLNTSQCGLVAPLASDSLWSCTKNEIPVLCKNCKAYCVAGHKNFNDYCGESPNADKSAVCIVERDSDALCELGQDGPGEVIGTPSIIWYGSWARGCEFKGNDYLRVPLRVACHCQTICDEIIGCTHFTWSPGDGGICFLKSADVEKVSKVHAEKNIDGSYRCGLASGHTTPEHPACCSLKREYCGDTLLRQFACKQFQLHPGGLYRCTAPESQPVLIRNCTGACESDADKEDYCNQPHQSVTSTIENIGLFLPYLASSGTLLACQTIWSPAKLAKLTLRGDGNLVLSQFGERSHEMPVMWMTGTDSMVDKPRFATLQADGDFRLYTANHELAWSLGSSGGKFTGASLWVLDAGLLCLTDKELRNQPSSSSDCLWTSSSNVFTDIVPRLPSPNTLGSGNAHYMIPSGRSMSVGEELVSSSQIFKFSIQDDGNAVLRDTNGTVKFLTYTNNLVAVPKSVKVLENGDVVLLGPDGHIAWRLGSASHETAGSSLAITEDADGALCLAKNDGQCVWKSRSTGQRNAATCRSTIPVFTVQSPLGFAPWQWAVSVLGCGFLMAFLFTATLIYARRVRQCRRAASTIDLLSMEHSRPRSDREAKKIRKRCNALRHLEISESSVVETSETLGSGQFCIVKKGFLIDSEDSRKRKRTAPVAIKFFAENVNDYEEEDVQYDMFLEEATILCRTGRHLNIVTLIGIVPYHAPYLLIMELCAHGSLQKYLQKARDAIIVVSGQLQYDFEPETADARVTTEESRPLTADNLISFSYQLARGLEHLVSRGIVHRDLAARNVLVAEHKVVKISDFGRARPRDSHDYAVIQSEEELAPVKWMAPEVLRGNPYTHQSDVWSFGILLWEIFSFGGTPFSAGSTSSTVYIGGNEQLARALAAGLQMDQPHGSPSFTYDLMRRCWEITVDERPTATMLAGELSRHITAESANIYLELCEQYKRLTR